MANSEDITSEQNVAELASTPAGFAKTEPALPQGADLFRRLFLGHPDGVGLIVKGRIALINDRLAEMSGYSTQEAIGMDPSVLVVPEDQQRVHDRLEDLQEHGDVYPSTYTLLCKNGSHLPIVVHSSPIQHDGETVLISVLRDVSKQRLAEEAQREAEEKWRLVTEQALRESESRFSTAFHDNPVPVLIARVSDGKLIDLNDAFLDMTGYRRSETIGRTIIELGLLVDSAERDRLTAAVRGHETVRDLPSQINKKTGDILDVLRTMTQIEVEGEPCLLTTIVDITERTRLEGELETLRDDLESKVERRIAGDNPYKLTFREFTVLHLIAAGKADKEIAGELRISIYTVHRHVSHILTKMDSPSRTEAGTRALREGLLE